MNHNYSIVVSKYNIWIVLCRTFRRNTVIDLVWPLIYTHCNHDCGSLGGVGHKLKQYEAAALGLLVLT